MPMELPDFVLLAVSILGIITIFKAIFSVLKWVWIMFLRLPKNLKDYGSWAVVTGSTDGIGKALAFELASKGLNLVLVGRNPLKLEAVSKKVRERHGEQVEVKNIVIDLDKVEGEEIARTMEKGIKGLDVGVLINNTGLSYPYAKFFHEVDVELMKSIIKVNVEGATWITRAVLPGMLKKKKRGYCQHWFGFWLFLPTLYLPFMLLPKRTWQCSQNVSAWNTANEELIFSARFHYLWQQR